MPTTATPIFPQSFQYTGTEFLNADSTNKKTIFTAGENGSKVILFIFTSNDTTERFLDIFINDGSADHQIGKQMVAAASGTGTGVVFGASNVLYYSYNTQVYNLGTVLPKDVNGNAFIYLPFGCSLKASLQTAVTSGKFIQCSITSEDF